MKNLLRFIFSLIIILNLLMFLPAKAQERKVGDPPCPAGATGKELQDCLTNVLNDLSGGKTGAYGEARDTATAQTELAGKIGSAAGIVLSFLGVIFLFYVVYAGVQWMTAGGNEQQVENARDRIVRATIGMVIVASAWGISSFIITKIQSSKTANTASTCADKVINPGDTPGWIYTCQATCTDGTDTGACPEDANKICCFHSGS